ncbi:MAG: S49 family peptidase [Sandaracinaceae bacterium]|nr:S49 family peptidase [Sandaracinaceae bacterium]
MWHAVRRLAARKPVVACPATWRASGGYYIASAAREIYAHPASIVGSIGHRWQGRCLGLVRSLGCAPGGDHARRARRG